MLADGMLDVCFVDPVMDMTCLQIACSYNRLDIVRHLLATKRAELDIDRLDSKKCTALHSTIGRSLSELALLLLDNGASHQLCDASGHDALQVAAIAGCLPVVEQLVRHRGADFRRRDQHGNTALHLAVIHQHDDVAVWLIKRGANRKCENRAGKTATALASEKLCMRMESIYDPNA